MNQLPEIPASASEGDASDVSPGSLPNRHVTLTLSCIRLANFLAYGDPSGAAAALHLCDCERDLVG